MVSVCFYFQVHQPFRLRKYSVFDINNSRNYFNGYERLDNERILRKVANKCYLPANKLMLELINKHPEFKISYSFSGVVLDQFEQYYPEVLESFKELVKTGNVEVLSETYYHSLAFLYSRNEFKKQVKLHQDKVKKLFKVKPKVFRNTELIYNNEIAKVVESLGFKGIIAEGADHILGWRSPNFLYKPPSSKLKVLLKNYKLSDDIAFRFSERSWSEWPLTAPKYSQWISAINGNGYNVNLFMDYETIGEHQWASTGIFDFLRALPNELLKHSDNKFLTPSEVVKSYEPVGVFDAPDLISWADVERDLSAWRSNQMQESALKQLYDLEPFVLATSDNDLINRWRLLQTSDHFYYMCTKWFADGDVHKYFNPYESPYDAFISFMNILSDLRARVNKVIL